MRFSPRCLRLVHSCVFLTSALLVSCQKQQPVQARQDNSPVQVRVVPVSARDIQRIVQSVGTLFPLDETIVSAEIEGRVTEVKADLGDNVAKGAVLVRI